MGRREKPVKRSKKTAAAVQHKCRARSTAPATPGAQPGKRHPGAEDAAAAMARTKSKPPAKKPRARHSVASLLAELRRSEESFRSLAASTAAPILLLSRDLVVLDLNHEAERLYGLSREEMVGQDYFRTLDREMQGGLRRADFEEVLAERPVRGIEGRVRRPDGTERVLLWNATRVNDGQGQALGVIAVSQDITERQSAEEALSEREARLSSIIATAPDPIITIDERGVVQSFSSAAEKLFGYTAGEVIGHNIKMLMPPPHRENHDRYIARYRRTGKKRIIGVGREVEAQRKDGTIFPVELAVGEAHFGQSRIFTGFIRDITARSRLEQELRQAQKMEAIGQLTGGLAHDFNNLLTVIGGNLEMLEPRLEREEDRELVSEAREATELGAKLANRLLAFGRRQPLNPKPLDLSALAGGMTDLLRRSLGETIRIESRLTPDLPLTLADSGQVENALLNLAINARDAMPEGGRLIIETARVEIDEGHVAAQIDVTPGLYVMLGVTDTGFGMSPEIQERAFEPFFTTKGPGTGSGLGLSMVYGLVKQLGGNVRLYSEIGRGTTVRIYLPASGGRAAESGHRATRRREQPPGGEILLVVEDDARVRRTSVRRLKELGYSVIEVESGRAALEVLDKGERIDLLFTDIVMPGGISGIELAREARRRRPLLKILLTSGYAEPAVIEDGMPANAGWLGKPYGNAELAAKLRALLDS
ncbi:MAG: PAS domain S-box protein [Alphaproteobacteria bacterium]